MGEDFGKAINVGTEYRLKLIDPQLAAETAETAISAATEQVAPELGAKTSTNDSIIHSQTKWVGPKLKARTLEHDKVYNSVDKMPEYPGGTDALLKYIVQNLKYPVKAQGDGIQGKVVVRFIINKHGKVEQAEIVQPEEIKQGNSLKEIHVFGYGKKDKAETDKVETDKAENKTNLSINLLEKEALRVVNSLPVWTPGERKGKKVAVYYTLPITFRLE